MFFFFLCTKSWCAKYFKGQHIISWILLNVPDFYFTHSCCQVTTVLENKGLLETIMYKAFSNQVPLPLRSGLFISIDCFLCKVIREAGWHHGCTSRLDVTASLLHCLNWAPRSVVWQVFLRRNTLMEKCTWWLFELAAFTFQERFPYAFKSVFCSIWHAVCGQVSQ